MDELSELLIDNKTDERFLRILRARLKQARLTLKKRSDDYCVISGGNETLSFDISAEKYEFARTKDPAAAERLTQRITAEFSVLERLESFTNGQEFLRFVVMRSDEIKSGMISTEFAGNLCKVICITGDNKHIRLLDEKCMKKWDVPKEVLFSVADRNMCRLLAKTELPVSSISIGRGIKCLDLKAEDSRLTASLMMCSGFHREVSRIMGHRFLVAAPSKDNIVVIGEVTNNVLERLGSAIVGEYRWASAPLTTDIFLFSSSGVEIAGHFSENV